MKNCLFGFIVLSVLSLSCKKEDEKKNYSGTYTTTTSWDNQTDSGTSELTSSSISFTQHPFGNQFGKMTMPCTIDNNGKINIPTYQPYSHWKCYGVGSTDGVSISLTITMENSNSPGTEAVFVTGYK